MALLGSTDDKPLVIDQYTFLDYKGTFGKGHLDNPVEFWVGEENMRRLQAYIVLESYYRNNSRSFIDTEGMDDQEAQDIKNGRREYGDPFIVVETALSSLLGDDQSIVVPEADDKGPSSKEVKYLQLLQKWATDERFMQKMDSCERSSVKTGDGVYVLGWNDDLERPRLEVWDPGFFFPVYDDEDPSEEFCKTVHIAYDFERENELGDTEKYLRRITWELVDLVAEGDEDDEDAPVQYKSDRKWNGAKYGATCLMSDMTWKYDDVTKDENEGPIYTLDINKVYETTMDEVDLEIDWIPIVHITNTDTDSGERFGISVLSPILQIVDDIIGTDTDLQAASATTGSPPMVVSGLVQDSGSGTVKSYGPGEIINTEDGGSASMVDTSRSLDALIKLCEKLLSRLSVNGRIPESLLGRIKPNEVPSGITLTLSFAPHTAMIRSMRLVRAPKYSLLLKMVGRFYMQKGQVDEIYDAALHFGTFLPADRQETTTMLVALMTAKLISLETAIRMMIEAGFPIDEVQAEVKRIQNKDFAGAAELMAVSGDVNEARKYLGLPPLTTAEIEEEDEADQDPEQPAPDEEQFPA